MTNALRLDTPRLESPSPIYDSFVDSFSDTPVNRYAVLRLDSSYYQKCKFWTRVVEVAALVALVAIGTIAGVWLTISGLELAAVLFDLLVVKIGHWIIDWCDRECFRRKLNRLEEISAIYEGFSPEMHNTIANEDARRAVCRLEAHKQWYEQNAAADQETHTRLEGELRQNPQDFDEKFANFIHVKQFLAIGKVYAAYYSLLVDNHKNFFAQEQDLNRPLPDTRELKGFCMITSHSRLHDFAEASLAARFVPERIAFLRLNLSRQTFTADEVVSFDVARIKELLLTDQAPPSE